MRVGAGSVVLSVVLCIVGGGVNDDDGVCQIRFSHVVECALQCKCLVQFDVVVLMFVVDVDRVECCLNFGWCCIFVVAVMI